MLREIPDSLEIKYIGDLCPVNNKYVSQKFVLSKRYRQAKDDLSIQARSYCRGKMLEGNLGIHIKTYYPRKHDIDAFIKFMLDSLNGIAYEDDSQIIKLEIEKHIDKDFKGAIISVYPMEQI